MGIWLGAGGREDMIEEGSGEGWAPAVSGTEVRIARMPVFCVVSMRGYIECIVVLPTVDFFFVDAIGV